MKVKRSDLKSKAKLNVNVTKKSSGNEEVLKKGNVVDIANKNVPHGTSIVGMSKGITKNMDNYESLRIDVWIAVPTEDDDYSDKFEEISSLLDEVLDEEVSEYLD